MARSSFRVTDNGVGLPPKHRAPADRALCHHPRQGHRAWPGDRAQDHGRPWRRNRPATMPQNDGKGEREVRLLDFPLSAKKPAREKDSEDEQERMLIASEILIVDDEEDIRELVAGHPARRGL